MALQLNPAALETVSPEDRAWANEQLEELERLQEDNPLQFFHACPEPCGMPGCKPHPKAHRFLMFRTRVKGFLGGNRSAKTTTGLADDLIQAVDEECLPDRLKRYKRAEPPFRCRILTPDFTETMEGVVYHKLREWAPKHQLLGGSWDKAYDKQLRKLRFRNGSQFSFMTYEQDLDKFGGTDLDRVHYDEEPPESIRKENRKRLIDRGGDELFTMTPQLGLSWSYDAVYERRHEDDFSIVEVSMGDNPHISPKEIEAYARDLSKEERESALHGRYVHFAGLVFPEFGERHIIPRPEPGHVKGQAIVCGIDPGLNFAGAAWIAFDKENRALLFDELFLKDMPSLEYFAQAIKAKNAEWGITPDYNVIDPSARNRQVSVDAERIEAELGRFGIWCIHGQNDHEAGAFQIKRRLQASPEPALLVTENCREAIHEFRRLRIKETPDGSFKILKEASPNARNEVLDAGRYALMSRPWAFVPQRDAPKHRNWEPGWAPPYEWFEARREPETTPMGSYT